MNPPTWFAILWTARHAGAIHHHLDQAGLHDHAGHHTLLASIQLLGPLAALSLATHLTILATHTTASLLEIDPEPIP